MAKEVLSSTRVFADPLNLGFAMDAAEAPTKADTSVATKDSAEDKIDQLIRSGILDANGNPYCKGNSRRYESYDCSQIEAQPLLTAEEEVEAVEEVEEVEQGVDDTTFAEVAEEGKQEIPDYFYTSQRTSDDDEKMISPSLLKRVAHKLHNIWMSICAFFSNLHFSSPKKVEQDSPKIEDALEPSEESTKDETHEVMATPVVTSSTTEEDVLAEIDAFFGQIAMRPTVAAAVVNAREGKCCDGQVDLLMPALMEDLLGEPVMVYAPLDSTALFVENAQSQKPTELFEELVDAVKRGIVLTKREEQQCYSIYRTSMGISDLSVKKHLTITIPVVAHDDDGVDQEEEQFYTPQGEQRFVFKGCC